MTSLDRQIESQLTGQNARRTDAEELRHERVTLGGSAPQAGLAKQLHDRDRRMDQLDGRSLHADRDWHVEQIEKSGPMGIWDAVAQQVESYVEKHEK